MIFYYFISWVTQNATSKSFKMLLVIKPCLRRLFAFGTINSGENILILFFKNTTFHSITIKLATKEEGERENKYRFLDSNKLKLIKAVLFTELVMQRNSGIIPFR